MGYSVLTKVVKVYENVHRKGLNILILDTITMTVHAVVRMETISNRFS